MLLDRIIGLKIKRGYFHVQCGVFLIQDSELKAEYVCWMNMIVSSLMKKSQSDWLKRELSFKSWGGMNDLYLSSRKWALLIY